MSKKDNELMEEKEYAVEDWEEDMEDGKASASFCYTCNHPGERELSTTDK